MSHAQVSLYYRTGHTIQNPSDNQLWLALRDVFAYADNPECTAWIEYGNGKGPCWTFRIQSSGNAKVIKYADASKTTILDVIEKNNLNIDTALEAWMALIYFEQV